MIFNNQIEMKLLISEPHMQTQIKLTLRRKREKTKVIQKMNNIKNNSLN